MTLILRTPHKRNINSVAYFYRTNTDQGETMRQPSYAGINTFFGAKTTELTELHDDIDVAILGLPFDGGVTHKPGARHGPEALRRASSLLSREFSYEGELKNIDTGRAASYSDIELRDCGDAPVVPTDIEETLARVQSHVEAVPASVLPVLLGGDHSLTYPSFVGRAATVDDAVGLVHLDAHTDAWGPSELYGEYYHSSPMNHIAASRYSRYASHALVGARGNVDTEFVDRIKSGEVHVETARDIHEEGIEECLERAIDDATVDVDHIYVTIDIDVVDPAFAPGTGTPSPGGLTSSDIIRAVELLGDRPEVTAVDLMEVSPPLDSTGSTAALGAVLLARFLQTYCR